jgi:peptidoglycan/xylan/chitin deacetylase (PgdA/CDA1 family)
MKRYASIALLLALIMTGCGPLSILAPFQATNLPSTASASWTVPPDLFTPATPQQPAFTITTTFTPTATASPTATATQTFTPAPTDTPTPEATATWVEHPSSDVVAPILLYHHIGDDGQNDNRYFVSPEVFEEQLKALRDWGYTGVTVSTIVNVLTQGGQLPERPVAITFDDGNEDVFTTAFPIMQQYGFPGTFYIVANRLGSPGFTSADQLKELVAAGWEIGSHSMSHIDLTINHDSIWQEMANSRIRLEQTIGTEVRTFAYPYGKVDPTVVERLQEYGYRAGMGLGISYEHTWSTLYYLNRLEVRRSYNLEAFAALLPWK